MSLLYRLTFLTVNQRQNALGDPGDNNKDSLSIGAVGAKQLKNKTRQKYNR